MNGITCHVLDTSLGKPVTGLKVRLALLEAAAFRELGQAVTDRDGRATQLLGDSALRAGVYRLSFEAGAHYRAAERESFYEWIEIQFRVTDPTEHYHVPLLLSPFGYSTYRGS